MQSKPAAPADAELKEREAAKRELAKQAATPRGAASASSHEPPSQSEALPGSEALEPPPQISLEQFLTQSEAEEEHRAHGTPTSPAERTSSQEAQAPQPLSESYAQSYPQLAKPAAKPRVSPTRVLQRGASEEAPPAKKQPKGSSEH